jgi:hypothetical protein
LAGIYDPPRDETKDAIRECSEAGIMVHMLTVSVPSLITLAIALIIKIGRSSSNCNCDCKRMWYRTSEYGSDPRRGFCVYDSKCDHL